MIIHTGALTLSASRVHEYTFDGTHFELPVIGNVDGVIMPTTRRYRAGALTIRHMYEFPSNTWREHISGKGYAPTPDGGNPRTGLRTMVIDREKLDTPELAWVPDVWRKWIMARPLPTTTVVLTEV
jgi:hypothetical protein